MHVSLGGEIGILTARVTATGLVYTGPCLIYWIMVCPTGRNHSLELSDGIAAGTTKWSAISAATDTPAAFPVNFNKPMEMATGIYCETFTALDECTIGYAILAG